MPQNTLSSMDLNNLGDNTNMFHSLVVVYAKSMSDASNWKTSTFGFYWDGTYIGSVQITDGVTGRELDRMSNAGCLGGGSFAIMSAQPGKDPVCRQGKRKRRS